MRERMKRRKVKRGERRKEGDEGREDRILEREETAWERNMRAP